MTEETVRDGTAVQHVEAAIEHMEEVRDTLHFEDEEIRETWMRSMPLQTLFECRDALNSSPEVQR